MHLKPEQRLTLPEQHPRLTLPVPPAGGEERMQYFRHVVSVPNASKTALAWSFSAFRQGELWIALITFLYLDFLDATG